MSKKVKTWLSSQGWKYIKSPDSADHTTEARAYYSQIYRMYPYRDELVSISVRNDLGSLQQISFNGYAHKKYSPYFANQPEMSSHLNSLRKENGYCLGINMCNRSLEANIRWLDRYRPGVVDEVLKIVGGKR